MLSEPLRRRLEELNRQPLPAPVRIFRGPEPAQPRPESTPRSAASPTPLVGLVRQGVVHENGLGAHLRIVVPLERLWPGGPGLVHKRHEFLRSQAAAPAPPTESARDKSGASIADLRMFVGSPGTELEFAL